MFDIYIYLYGDIRFRGMSTTPIALGDIARVLYYVNIKSSVHVVWACLCIHPYVHHLDHLLNSYTCACTSEIGVYLPSWVWPDYALYIYIWDSVQQNHPSG